jgi:hypothetical protein
MVKTMPRQLDVQKIIAHNPKIDAEALEKGIEALKKLAQTGVVKPSAYSLETPDSKRSFQHCGDAVSVPPKPKSRLENQESPSRVRANAQYIG